VDPDGVIYVFRLRQGVLTTGRQPFTSSIVITKLSEWSQAKSGNVSLEAVDDFTIIVRCLQQSACATMFNDFSQIEFQTLPE
jgi:hypothetical protein